MDIQSTADDFLGGEMEFFSNLFGKPVVCANKCDRGGSSVVFVAD
jgi:hypothetical protein